MGENIRSHRELRVCESAFEAAMEIFEVTKQFPDDERFGLVSQIRRSSRSVCSNISEAWRKRRYRDAFIAKLSDAETEAGETQSHLEFAVACGYLARERARRLYTAYNSIMRTLIGMINHAEDWVIRRRESA